MKDWKEARRPGRFRAVGGKLRRLALLLAIAVLLLAGALAFALCRGMALLSALDGRLASEEVEPVWTEFDRLSEMNSAQNASLVKGWLSVARQEEVALQTPEGELRATLFAPLQGEAGRRCAIVFHGGRGTTRAQVVDVACTLSLRDYAVLTPDLRAHGASAGRFSSFGCLEAEDVVRWSQWAREQMPGAEIALIGMDEGANAVLLAAGSGKLPENVRAAVADSAFTSLRRRAEEALAQSAGLHLPMDFELLRLALWLNGGGWMKDGAVETAAARSSVPLLLIAGTRDRKTPAWQSEDIALAAGERARLLFIEGADSGAARFLEPETYYSELFRFFDEE